MLLKFPILILTQFKMADKVNICCGRVYQHNKIRLTFVSVKNTLKMQYVPNKTDIQL